MSCLSAEVEPPRTRVHAVMDYSSSVPLQSSHLCGIFPNKHQQHLNYPRESESSLNQAEYIGKNVLITGVVTATRVFTFGLKGMHVPLKYFHESSKLLQPMLEDAHDLFAVLCVVRFERSAVFRGFDSCTNMLTSS